jgi:arylsulfatase A
VGVTDFIPGHWRPYEEVTVPTNKTQFLPGEIITYAEGLREAGYTTGYFGKWHLNETRTRRLMPDEQGYDSVVVYSDWGYFDLENKLVPQQLEQPEDYLSEVLTEKSLAFLEANRDGPFMLTLAHFAVHIPLEARQVQFGWETTNSSSFTIADVWSCIISPRI